MGLAAALSGCASESKVKVTSRTTPAVLTEARSEPIHYNGRNYRIAYAYDQPSKAFDVKVTGVDVAMRQSDQKHAVNITTSAVRYFSCPDPLSAHILGQPRFANGTWRLQARCA